MSLGVIGGSAAVIYRAEAVNAAKDALRERCKAINHLRVRIPVKAGKGGRVVKSLPMVRVILRELQRSDLSLLAAYRQIPALTGRVLHVAYTRARSRGRVLVSAELPPLSHRAPSRPLTTAACPAR